MSKDMDALEEFLPDMVKATGMSESEIRELFKQRDKLIQESDKANANLDKVLEKLSKTNEVICAMLLEAFQVAKSPNPKDIKNLKVHQSQSYSLGPVLAFDYNGKHYYAVDDYSLGDDPEMVKNILLDINHLLKGNILEYPVSQAGGTKYAAQLDGVEYYLWENPLIT